MKRFRPDFWKAACLVLAALSLFLLLRKEGPETADMGSAGPGTGAGRGSAAEGTGAAASGLPAGGNLRPESSGAPPGMWHPFRDNTKAGPLTAEQKKKIAELEATGYASGTRPAGPKKGVTLFDRKSASPGFNLYISGHAAEAFLIDMEGKLLHRWAYPMERVWPEYAPPPGFKEKNKKYWRRVRLLENGDLLAVYEGYGLIRIDKDSNLLWAWPGKCHHDLDVTPDGEIFVLTRKAGIVPLVHPTNPTLQDFISVLDMKGRYLRKLDLLKCFVNSRYVPTLAWLAPGGDIFHTNTVEVLDGRLADRCPAFKKGNILVSVRMIDVIAVVDPAAEKIVWEMQGMWRQQHQPTVLENGRMLIFDNLGNMGRSRVMEFDPFTQEVLWQYPRGRTADLYSETCGSCQRLPNGDTLITESDNGRVLEVTAGGRIVWEFVNPHRAGKKGELIAALFEMIRLPADLPLDWLDPAGGR